MRVSQKEYDLISAYAASKDLSRGALLRKALEEYLARQ